MNFQEEFSHYLISGDHSALKHYIEGDYDPRILSVYRNGFYKACIEALAANYPVTKILFGEEHFNFLAQRHVQQQPPEQGTLVGYGDDFIETVKAVYVQQGENLPQSYADIAMLDRAWITCLNGADDINNLSAERIQQLATGNVNIENLEVKLSNNVFIQSLDPQAFNFWFNSRYPEQTIEEMPPTAQCHLLIWRAGRPGSDQKTGRL